MPSDTGPKNHTAIKSKKKKKPLKKFLKVTFITSIILFFALTGIILGTIVGFIQTSDVISPEDLALKGFTTNLYDYEGNFIAPLHGDKNREWVDINELPESLKNAFIAIEDKRFYQHPGIDIKRTLGAVVKFLQSSDSTHGGSTITQQVVKNLTNETERTIQRKLQEQWRAIELERHLEKDQILEIYVNVIYMGNNAYGVQSASKLYFQKDASELSLAESAVIAGITNLPGVYNPFTENGKKSIEGRQEIILSEMKNLGFITEEEYENALLEELQYAAKNSNSNSNQKVQSYFVDQVVTDVRKGLMDNGYSFDLASKMIYNNGLKIYTTMDTDLQKHVEDVFSNKENFPIMQQNLPPKASMVVLDSKTAQVRALYGGAGPKEISMGFNFATDLKKQPGSTMKPIAVYAPAIDTKRITAATVFDDIPLYLDNQNPEDRYPTNYNKDQYWGLVSVRDALKVSLNTVAAQIWTMDSSFSRSALSYLKKVDINREKENYVSTALGGLEDGVSPLQMAAAYVPFVNKGVYQKPVTFTKVEDSRGNVLLENTSSTVIVYDDTTAYIMTDLLTDVVKPGGTAHPYGLVQGGKIPSAGKTGTTSENFDKWFVGYTPYYVGATWYGYEQNTTLTPSEYGKALSLWSDVMERIHQTLPPKPFEAPSGITRVVVDKYSGKVPSLLANEDPRGNALKEEIFAVGTEPNKNDPSELRVKVTVSLDHQDGFGRNLLWPLDVPKSIGENLGERVFIKRPVPYIPKNDADPYPMDWIYELPTEVYKVDPSLLETEPSSTDKKKLDAEKKKLDAEKKRLDAEKKKLDAENEESNSPDEPLLDPDSENEPPSLVEELFGHSPTSKLEEDR